jgi:hypothetical protein
MSTGKWKRPHPRKTGAQIWALRKPSEGDNLLIDIRKAQTRAEKIKLVAKYNPFFYTFFEEFRHEAGL